jgi:hypothetical protein
MAKRVNMMASYFVQMRELERRLITSALDVARRSLDIGVSFDKQLAVAAGLLGVHSSYLRVRARVLGGVFEGDPKHEPPTTTATKVWGEENGAGRTRAPSAKPRKTKAAPPKLTIVPEPEPEPDA